MAEWLWIDIIRGDMTGKAFLLTEATLAEIPDEKLCTVCMEDDDFRMRTREEVGQLCKEELQKICRAAEMLDDTVVLCAEEYDVIYLMRITRLSEPIYMDWRELQALAKGLAFLTADPNPSEEVIPGDEYSYYLWRFRKKKPMFTEAGILLTINLGEKRVNCIQPSARVTCTNPLSYPITKDGYYAATSLLYTVRRRKGLTTPKQSKRVACSNPPPCT